MVRPQRLNGEEPEKSEDNIQRELLGPRGVPGAPDPARMTSQVKRTRPSTLIPATLPRVAIAAGSQPTSAGSPPSGRLRRTGRYSTPPLFCTRTGCGYSFRSSKTPSGTSVFTGRPSALAVDAQIG